MATPAVRVSVALLQEQLLLHALLPEAPALASRTPLTSFPSHARGTPSCRLPVPRCLPGFRMAECPSAGSLRALFLRERTGSQGSRPPSTNTSQTVTCSPTLPDLHTRLPRGLNIPDPTRVEESPRSRGPQPDSPCTSPVHSPRLRPSSGSRPEPSDRTPTRDVGSTFNQVPEPCGPRPLLPRCMMMT